MRFIWSNVVITVTSLLVSNTMVASSSPSKAFRCVLALSPSPPIPSLAAIFFAKPNPRVILTSRSRVCKIPQRERNRALNRTWVTSSLRNCSMGLRFTKMAGMVAKKKPRGITSWFVMPPSLIRALSLPLPPHRSGCDSWNYGRWQNVPLSGAGSQAEWRGGVHRLSPGVP